MHTSALFLRFKALRATGALERVLNRAEKVSEILAFAHSGNDDDSARAASHREWLCEALATWLFVRESCSAVVSAFRPVILELVERGLVLRRLGGRLMPGSASAGSGPGIDGHTETVLCLGIVLSSVPGVGDLALRFLGASPSPFESLSLVSDEDIYAESATALSSPSSAVGERLRLVARAAYEITRPELDGGAYISELRKFWDWSPLLRLLPCPDRETRWFASQALVRVATLPDEAVMALDRYSRTAGATRDDVISLLSLRESLRGAVQGASMLIEADCSKVPGDLSEAKEESAPSSLPSSSSSSSSFVNVCGVRLPRNGASAPAAPRAGSAGATTSSISPSSSSSGPVMTATTQDNIRSLARAVAQNSPVLVVGNTGSGKSTLVKELARRTGNAAGLVELHLDDQIDSKTLLGTYVCSDVPGEFRWSPGVITQAVYGAF